MSSTVSLAPRAPSLFADLLRGVRRHKALFAVVALLVTAVAAGITALLPARYTAYATVVVTPASPDPLAASGGREDAPVRDDETATQAALMASRDLALLVAERLPVGAAPGLGTHARLRLCALLGPSLLPADACRPPPEPTAEDRAASFLLRLRAQPVPRTRVIELSYADAEPDLAAAALNELVEQFQRNQITLRAADLSRTSAWISERAEALRQSWLGAEARAGQFRTANGLAPAGAREQATPLVTQQVATAASGLARAQEELSAARARAAALRAARGAPDRSSFIMMRDEPGLVALNTQLAQLRTQLAEMRQQFSPTYPGFAGIAAQVASVERQLAAETQRALAAVEKDVLVRQAQADNLAASLRDLRAEAGDLNAQQVQLSTLEDQARSARTVFETFLARARQLDDRAGLLQAQVQFAAHASAADAPSFPARGRLLLGGAALGLALGFAAVTLREATARGFRDVSRVGNQLSLPFLGAIPAVEGWRAANRRLPRHVDENPFSGAAEAVRSILTHLHLRAAPDHPLRSLVVASATGQEGKTTTAIWLASAAARGGRRVILLDGDHRRGTVRERLGGGGPSPGFSELVFDGTPLRDAVQHDAKGGFDFIPAGSPVARSFDRADVDRLRALLAVLRAEYDLVVIDTPPMLAMTDTFLYARLADATLFLCRWSRTGREAVSGCLSRLREADANVLGVALSMVDGARLAQFSDELTRRDLRVIKRYYAG